jgi:hypothetical protein
VKVTPWLVRSLLGAALVFLAILLLHPPERVLPLAAVQAGEPLPSLEPLARLATDGHPETALVQLAGLVRRHPALADRNGPLDETRVLRDLILRDWKQAVELAPDRQAALRDVRFLQRRLAGGCS